MGIAPLVERMMWPLKRRVLLMVGRAVLRLVDDAPGIQVVQVEAMKDEIIDGPERIQQYGMSSRPLPGAEAVVLSCGGVRQHSLVVAVDDRRHRVRGLEEGEVCLYTDEDAADAPMRILLGRGRRIVLSAGASRIEMSDAGINLVARRIDHTRAS